MDITLIYTYIEIIVGLIAIGGTLLGGWRLIINPIRRIISLQEDHIKKQTLIDDTLNNKVLPIINSLEKEFSKNGGKSIKDQINRIDDCVTLAELRSKMIASSLSTTGAYECDANGACTWSNKALCDMFGLTPEETLGNGWLSGVDESERIDVWKKWKESIELGVPYETEYTIFNHKTNNKVRVRTIAITHRSVSGKLLGYYGTVVQIH